MICSPDAMAEARGAAVAYAMYEGDRLLFGDPLYMAYLGEGRGLAVAEKPLRRCCPFHLEGRELSLSLLLLSAEKLPPSEAEVLLREAEDRFFLFLYRLREEESLPLSPVLLPHALASLREYPVIGDMPHIRMRAVGGEPLPVRIRSGALFLELGLLLSVCGHFGETLLTLESGGEESRLTVSLPMAVPPPFSELLSALARVGGFAVSADLQAVTFTMLHVMSAVCLRESREEGLRAFLCGAYALSAPPKARPAL